MKKEYYIEELKRFGNPPQWAGHSGPFETMHDARARIRDIGNKYTGLALRIVKRETTETVMWETP